MLHPAGDTLTDATSGPVATARLRDALPGGARRRVPGHRPGAVDDPARGLPRPPHPGADRRPEAGHLRLPRRRRARLPRGARRRRRWCARCRPTTAATQPLLDGMAAVFGGAALGDERIRVLPVDGRARRPAGRRGGAVAAAGAARATGCRSRSNGRCATAAGPRRRRRATSPTGSSPCSPAARLLHPARRRQPRGRSSPGHRGAGAHQHPGRAGAGAACRPPACRSCSPARPRVFATPAAAEWQRLLEALEQPHRTTRVRRAGADLLRRARRGRAGRAPATPSPTTSALQLRIWGAVLEDRGVAAMFEAVSLDRAAAAADARPGRRRAAAHRPAAHRAGAARGGAGGPARPDRAAGLAAPAHARRPAGEGGQERSRRLETDAAAVQIITVHTSKGLEFPVVLVPFAWDHFAARRPGHRGLPRRARPPGARRRRPGQPRLGSARAPAQAGGDRRRAAPHLRRADPRAVAPAGLVGADLQHADVAAAPAAAARRRPDRRAAVGQGARATRTRWRRSAPGRRRAAAAWAIEVVRARPPSVWSPAAPGGRRWSWPRSPGRWTPAGGARPTARLTSAAHEQRLGSEPEVAQKDDEADLEDGRRPVPLDAATTPPARRRLGVGRAARRRGVRHARARRAGAGRRPGRRRRGARGGGRAGGAVRAGTRRRRADSGLLAALATPLGPLADGLRAGAIVPARGPAAGAGLRAAAGRRRRRHGRAGAARRPGAAVARAGCRPGRCRRTPTRWPS